SHDDDENSDPAWAAVSPPSSPIRLNGEQTVAPPPASFLLSPHPVTPSPTLHLAEERTSRPAAETAQIESGEGRNELPRAMSSLPPPGPSDPPNAPQTEVNDGEISPPKWTDAEAVELLLKLDECHFSMDKCLPQALKEEARQLFTTFLRQAAGHWNSVQ